MQLRCIMIFPGFEETYRIEALREKFDPLFGVDRPHITLVFPFTSDLTKDELHAHISFALSGFGPFPIVMRGISAHHAPDGHYIFMDFAEGEEMIRRVSGSLYEGPLKKFKSDRYDADYAPHITLGRFPDEAALQSALTQIGDFSHEFSTTVRKLDVEVIGEDGSSAIEMTIPLS